MEEDATALSSLEIELRPFERVEVDETELLAGALANPLASKGLPFVLGKVKDEAECGWSRGDA